MMWRRLSVFCAGTHAGARLRSVIAAKRVEMSLDPCRRECLRHQENLVPTLKRALLVSVLAVATTAVIVRSFQAQPARDDSASATYSHGILRANIPYEATHSGGGELIVDILDPEDASVGHTEKHLDIAPGHGLWQEEMKLAAALPLEDLMWHRVRYRFTYANSRQAAIEGAESLSQILRTPLVHVLGQQSYLAGGPAAVRVIVTDSGNEVITGPGLVQIELVTPNQKSPVLYTGRLD